MAEVLRRYTNIPALIYMLKEKTITLLDPQTWDDKNDSHFLSAYKQKKSLKSVVALCFAQASETYHHWRVFADGSSGVCVRFNRDEFVAAVTKKAGLRADTVQYLSLRDIEGKNLKVEDLPFLKRAPYVDECEFRLIYQSKKKKFKSLDVPIPLGCIDRVTLSPWIPSALVEHLKETIRAIPDCKKLKVFRSTLISNERWKKASDTAK
jgi:hypothetical protein